MPAEEAPQRASAAACICGSRCARAAAARRRRDRAPADASVGMLRREQDRSPESSSPRPRCDEEQQYDLHCKRTHQQFVADLEKWRYKRALVIRFAGRKDWWGLGHALTAVFDLHHLCRQLHRFCYISIFEMNLGLMFGYANGLSWHPEPAELERYPNRVAFQDFPPGIFGTFHAFSERVRKLENVSLVDVTSINHIVFMRHFRYAALPLPPNARAQKNAWFVTRGRIPPLWATRCWCRFVTATRFDCARQIPSVAYHLRTGFADVDVRALAGLTRRNLSAVSRWLGLACPSLRERPRVHVMSDSPAVAALAYHKASRTEPKASSRLWNVSRHSTRSWDSPFAVQLAVSRDLCEGGQAEILHISMLSSFADPMVARSMCIRQVQPVDDLRKLAERKQLWVPGAESILKYPRVAQKMAENVVTRCPHWSFVFPRNMYTDSNFADRYEKLQANLPKWHPCSGRSAKLCRSEFIAATA